MMLVAQVLTLANNGYTMFVVVAQECGTMMYTEM